MNLLPDFIDTQPDEGLVADVRKLAEAAVSELGGQMTPELLEVLTGILVAGSLTATSAEIDNAETASSQHTEFPAWAEGMFLVLRQLAVTSFECRERRSYAARPMWIEIARRYATIALQKYESTTP